MIKRIIVVCSLFVCLLGFVTGFVCNKLEMENQEQLAKAHVVKEAFKAQTITE